MRMERSRRRHWKTVPVTVVLPDCSAYFMELHEDCRGHDCLAKVRDVKPTTVATLPAASSILHVMVFCGMLTVDAAGCVLV